MGHSISRSLRIRDRAQSNLGDLYSQARHFGLSHATILERRAEIFTRLGVNKAPHWVSSYLEGYWKHTMDCAYRYDLVFGGIVDGVFYSTHHDRADYYEKHGISPCDYSDDGRVTARGHYWRESLKPFFTMEQARVVEVQS